MHGVAQRDGKVRCGGRRGGLTAVCGGAYMWNMRARRLKGRAPAGMLKRAVRQFGQFGWVRPTVLLLVICHLGRFYSDAPAALAICFGHEHFVAGLMAEDHHHAHGSESGGHQHPPDDGFRIEHCRDVYQGFGVAYTAVLAVPTQTSLPVPRTRGEPLPSPEPASPLDPALAIFHPPQLLS